MQTEIRSNRLANQMQSRFQIITARCVRAAKRAVRKVENEVAEALRAARRALAEAVSQQTSAIISNIFIKFFKTFSFFKK